LNQLLLQLFDSNIATNLHHLSTQSKTSWPTKWRFRPQICDATSSYVYYSQLHYF